MGIAHLKEKLHDALMNGGAQTDCTKGFGNESGLERGWMGGDAVFIMNDDKLDMTDDEMQGVLHEMLRDKLKLNEELMTIDGKPPTAEQKQNYKKIMKASASVDSQSMPGKIRFVVHSAIIPEYQDISRTASKADLHRHHSRDTVEGEVKALTAMLEPLKQKRADLVKGVDDPDNVKENGKFMQNFDLLVKAVDGALKAILAQKDPQAALSPLKDMLQSTHDVTDLKYALIALNAGKGARIQIERSLSALSGKGLQIS